ncbi:hypothetical protein L218DRAFT_700939 [Marasmius fiardii PR-910]|nr:hypothetical protein L218DRAFT_700939 [Marasmius fiardii PR-910]
MVRIGILTVTVSHIAGINSIPKNRDRVGTCRLKHFGRDHRRKAVQRGITGIGVAPGPPESRQIMYKYWAFEARLVQKRLIRFDVHFSPR